MIAPKLGSHLDLLMQSLISSPWPCSRQANILLLRLGLPLSLHFLQSIGATRWIDVGRPVGWSRRPFCLVVLTASETRNPLQFIIKRSNCASRIAAAEDVQTNTPPPLRPQRGKKSKHRLIQGCGERQTDTERWEEGLCVETGNLTKLISRTNCTKSTWVFDVLTDESLLSRPDIGVLVWILGVIPFPSSTLGPSGCPPSLRASVRLSVGGREEREDATDRQCFAGPSDLPSFPKTKCSA